MKLRCLVTDAVKGGASDFALCVGDEGYVLVPFRMVLSVIEGSVYVESVYCCFYTDIYSYRHDRYWAYLGFPYGGGVGSLMLLGLRYSRRRYIPLIAVDLDKRTLELLGVAGEVARRGEGLTVIHFNTWTMASVVHPNFIASLAAFTGCPVVVAGSLSRHLGVGYACCRDGGRYFAVRDRAETDMTMTIIVGEAGSLKELDEVMSRERIHLDIYLDQELFKSVAELYTICGVV